MNLVQIEGDAELFARLGNIVDLTFSTGVVRDEATGRLSAGAYASDDAIDTIRALGCDVEILKDNDQLEQHFDQFYSYSDDDDIS